MCCIKYLPCYGDTDAVSERYNLFVRDNEPIKKPRLILLFMFKYFQRFKLNKTTIRTKLNEQTAKNVFYGGNQSHLKVTTKLPIFMLKSYDRRHFA